MSGIWKVVVEAPIQTVNGGGSKGAVPAPAARGRPHKLGPCFSAEYDELRGGGAGAWTAIWPLHEECGLWLVPAFRLAQECEQGVHCAPWMHKLVLLPRLNTKQSLVSQPTEPAEYSGPVHPGGRGVPAGVRAGGPGPRALQGSIEGSYGLRKTQNNVFGHLGKQSYCGRRHRICGSRLPTSRDTDSDPQTCSLWKTYCGRHNLGQEEGRQVAQCGIRCSQTNQSD